MKDTGTPGNTLDKITLPDGTLLVPPGQPQANIDAATSALHAVSDIIVGGSSPSIGNVKYVYKSTPFNLARVLSSNAADRKLRHLDVRPDLGFELDLRDKGAFKFRKLPPVDANTKPLISIGDFLGTFGDLFSDIWNGIYDVIGVVIQALDSGYQATVTSIVEGTTKTWQGVVQFVEEAAALAEFVFDAIKASIDRVITWLKFMSDIDSIRRVARKFNASMVATGPQIIVTFVAIL